MSERTVTVVPTVSIPQGIAALISFNPLLEPATNIENMHKARMDVRSGAICKAARSVQINNLAIALGDFMGLLEREVVVTGHEIENTAENLLDCLNPDGSLITLYWGDSIDEYLATRCMEVLVEKYPNTDFELVYGGQPYYEFIISIE